MTHVLSAVFVALTASFGCAPQEPAVDPSAKLVSVETLHRNPRSTSAAPFACAADSRMPGRTTFATGASS